MAMTSAPEAQSTSARRSSVGKRRVAAMRTARIERNAVELSSADVYSDDHRPSLGSRPHRASRGSCLDDHGDLAASALADRERWQIENLVDKRGDDGAAVATGSGSIHALIVSDVRRRIESRGVTKL
jgi:hypothetical protein